MNNKNIPYKKWFRIDGGWQKILYHDWYTIIDDWGLPEKNRNVYKIDVMISRIFTWRDGFNYQIKVPDFTINDKNPWIAVSEVLRHLYRGGCPCYYRLMDQLLDKGLWGKL